MPQPVIDVGSNLEENLERWSGALQRGGDKLSVFSVIYSGKRRRWPAAAVSRFVKGKLSRKRVTTAGKKLVGESLIRQVKDYPVVYEKIPSVHHYKAQILSLVKDPVRRDGLPTKRRSRMTVHVHNQTNKLYQAVEFTIDDVDQFARVRASRGQSFRPRRPLPESTFKVALQRLFSDSGEYQDWGGEKDDFFTNKLKMKGKRYNAAFALKGPGVGVKTMTPGKWGKNGNQIQRLTEAPARVFALQFEGTIHEDSIDQLKRLVEHKAQHEKRKLFYGYIDRDDCLRLRHAYPGYF
jgi:hypothetical protein